ncbi:hypothetical protein NUR11_002583 [Salmonella enterica]|nr:hypothetical protein [Salmonella enterica]
MTPSELSDLLWAQVDRVAPYLLPNGKKDGHEWVAGNVNGDKGNSLKVNLSGKKKWADFAEGDGGDMLDLWMACRGINLHQAMQEAKAFLGIREDDHHFDARREKKFSRPDRKKIARYVTRTESHLEYLQSRGISPEVAKRYEVVSGKVWNGERELSALVFPYKRDGELLQVKRISTERPDGKKVIMAEGDCEPCLFGYPASEIDQHYTGLEGTLAPLGHPQVNGQFVSAFSPEGLNVGYVGAWNKNVKKSGNRVYVEKWIDTEVAKRTDDGKRLLERLEALEKGDDVPPIHTSVAVFLEELEANDEQKAQGASWVAKIHAMDHDAILLDEVGAATPEQGVGMMVNADLATPLKANSGALVGETYRERERRLEKYAKDKFAPGEKEYAWVADFTDSQAVIILNNGDPKVYGYKSEGGKIVFDDTWTEVQRQSSWVAVVNKLKSFFTPQDNPAPNHKMEGDMPLTKEELEQIGSMVSEAVATNTEKAIKPLAEKVDALQANQQQLSEALTANSRAEEKTKREAVAKVHGEIVANALSGEALDAMYKTIGDAAPLGTNSAQHQKETGAPAASEYFK